MRHTRILAALAMLAAIGGPAYAQNGCARLSWGTCDPWAENRNFSGPGTYVLVESVFGLSAANVGSDTEILLTNGFPPISDAWRFDDAGCQGGSRLTVSQAGLSKACPAMNGSNGTATTNYTIDGQGHAIIRLTAAYDSFIPLATTHYTLWQLSFDHSYSTAGPTPDDKSTCGGAEIFQDFYFQFVHVATSGGQVISLPGCDTDPANPCAAAAWDGGTFENGGYFCPPPVATLPATWARVKSLYR